MKIEQFFETPPPVINKLKTVTRAEQNQQLHLLDKRCFE
jgi:hypothetical protein